ncbi:Uncharacterised protein [Mycobacteroides abscessus subsp. abscessus]|nr:Uncharacterised protein [Mycobacteroides abscessus subsp. abscessus]
MAIRIDGIKEGADRELIAIVSVLGGATGLM